MRNLALGICALASAVSYATLSYAAPSVGEIVEANHAATGGSAWDGKATLKLAFSYSGQGMTGTAASLDDLRNGWFADNFKIGPINGAQGYDGVHSWGIDQSGTVTLQDGGAQTPISVNEAFRRSNALWRADRGGADVVFDGEKTDGGATYDVLTITPKGGKNFDAWIDAKSHLLVRTIEVQGANTTTTTLSDYRNVDGVELPFLQVQSTGDTKYDQTMTITSAVFAPAQDQSAYSAPKVTVNDFSIANGSETSFPFKLLNNHIYADVSVNGKGPYQFIFDTGGVNVVAPRIVSQLDLKTEGHIEGNGAGAGHMDFGVAKVNSLALGDAVVKNQVFIVAPFEQMEPVEGVGMPGMVGYETFRRFVTRFDYGTGTVTLIMPKAFDPKDAGTPIPIAFDGNTIEADGAYNGIPGKFTIDTGARQSLTLDGPFVKKNDLTKDSNGVEMVTGWGVGGATTSFVMHGRELAIGAVKIENPITELSTDKGGASVISEIAGNIGAGILKRFIVTLDYEHSVMYLKPVTKPVEDLDTFDRAGLWINQDSDGYQVVDVTKGAPAEAAGLKAGDDVVAVNGKPATSIPLYDMRRQLRDEPAGTVVTFTVKRGGATQDLRITLRDLI